MVYHHGLTTQYGIPDLSNACLNCPPSPEVGSSSVPNQMILFTRGSVLRRAKSDPSWSSLRDSCSCVICLQGVVLPSKPVPVRSSKSSNLRLPNPLFLLQGVSKTRSRAPGLTF